MPFNAAIDDQNEYQLRIVPQVPHTAREKLNNDANYVSEFEIPRLDELASNNTGRVERIHSHNQGHPTSRSREPTLRDLLQNPKTSKSSNSI